MKAALYLSLSIFGLFLLIVAYQLFGEGMFMDGTYYATIARNMAENVGTLWQPHLTETVAPVFVDHPPLAFGLQSLFFSVFGDHLWVENIYSLCSYVLTALLGVKIFKHFSKKEQQINYWLFLLLWMTAPKMTWSVSNNLLENTLMLFTTASILSQLYYVKKKKLVFLVISAACLLLGFLTKGFVAFFPLSFLFFYRIMEPSFQFKKIFIEQLTWLLIVILIIFFFFLLMPAARENIMEYLNIQIFQNMQNEVTVGSRFFILRKAFEENLTQLILLALLWFFYRKKVAFEAKRYLPLLLTALAGVLPIMISLKQSTFYINPTLPLFSIFFSLMISEVLYFLKVTEKIITMAFWSRPILPIVLIGLGISFSIYSAQQTTRNKKQLEDIKAVLHFIGEEKAIAISDDLIQEWSYHGYFHRYGKVSLHWKNHGLYPIYISRSGIDPELQDTFEASELELNELQLFVRIQP